MISGTQCASIANRDLPNQGTGRVRNCLRVTVRRKGDRVAWSGGHTSPAMHSYATDLVRSPESSRTRQVKAISVISDLARDRIQPMDLEAKP